MKAANTLKSILGLILFSTISFAAQAQFVFWSEAFSNGCASNCLANTYGGWTIQDNVGGTSGASSNNWYVSCAEEGVAPPGCGSSCIGDPSLHIGSDPGSGGDQGATFNETGIVNATFKRVMSPIISTVGKSNITLKFDFIAFGSAACSDDRAQLQLSADGGATWPVGYQYCLTSTCCGACNGYSQGMWTLYSLALPAAFDNNPNVRVAFHWRNNGNGSGTDPSAAIDDIQLSSPTPLPVTLVSFNAAKEGSKVKLNWVIMAEDNVKAYEVERANESLKFQKIGSVAAIWNQNSGSMKYNFTDAQPLLQSAYYRLKMVDMDGKYTYSKVVRVAADGMQEDLMILTTDAGHGKLNFSVWAGYDMSAVIVMYDLQGKKVAQMPGDFVKGVNEFSLKAGAKLASGNYIIKISSVKAGQLSLLNASKKFLYTE